jgi:antitoxin ParD1/3/4
MNAEKLSITLPADMAQMVRSHVATGAYASNSEVIRDALRLWNDRAQERENRLMAVRAKIDAAARNPKRVTDEEVGRHFDQLATNTGEEPKP